MDQYKYLGIVFNYSLHFEFTADILAKSGDRALGSIICKFQQNKGLGFKIYTKLMNVVSH